MNEMTLDAGTVWMVVSAGLVLLMTPGLALFYGGMVRSKSVLNMMMMCLTAIPVVWLLWVAFGYSMTFGPDRGGVVGDPTTFAGLRGLLGAFGLVLLGVTALAAWLPARAKGAERPVRSRIRTAGTPSRRSASTAKSS